MPVTFSRSNGDWGANNPGHTITVEPGESIVVWQSCQNPNANPHTCTIAGVSVPLIGQDLNGSLSNTYCFALLNPPVGTNLAVAFPVIGSYDAACTIVLKGVGSFGTPVQHTTGKSITASTEAGWYLTSGWCNRGSFTATNGVQRFRRDTAGFVNLALYVADLTSTTSPTSTIEITAADTTITGLALPVLPKAEQNFFPLIAA
ncbi:hypothetical protein PBI_SEBATA_117 [Mycobacterium phage Sebata]|uniref:Minor tail protein n=3 Tax=Bixzunavirus TaxID=680114 RepID=G1JXK7_9CAUD|nr:hypothetical protein DANDELION_122 [Mycobacterium phage Dandelion]YP_009014704.1 hypothetical protein LINSTU_115 [Mycobacterium phage LinStu]YP_009608797.1 hypothetical protein FDI20_gp202 [Mycobacterium phage Sebata]AEK06589.1 hypothetical protein PBI_SEBATA_117 [Mycobacterium phage Sebata]AEL97787.1 hypothetical protein DANDELION_122 [Mycobacterium phage Dandelion]AEL98352.1 hypothetical protein LINSTU_115 [Mycobacterium phage LinStu]